MNWIATRFTELVTKVDNLLTAHSDLARRVEALEAELKEPPSSAPAAAEVKP
jgi:hypothetical protein